MPTRESFLALLGPSVFSQPPDVRMLDERDFGAYRRLLVDYATWADQRDARVSRVYRNQ